MDVADLLYMLTIVLLTFVTTKKPKHNKNNGLHHKGGVIISPDANGGTLEDLDTFISPDLPNNMFSNPLPLLVSLGARFSK